MLRTISQNWNVWLLVVIAIDHDYLVLAVLRFPSPHVHERSCYSLPKPNHLGRESRVLVGWDTLRKESEAGFSTNLKSRNGLKYINELATIVFFMLKMSGGRTIFSRNCPQLCQSL